MTQQRRDTHGTEFSDWLRKQKEIDSSLGFITSNIDFVWSNYKTGLWMLIEEKRYRRLPKFYQIQLYKILDTAGKQHALYRGFHLAVFENTSPDDGGIWLDGRYIVLSDFFKFLKFEHLNNWYFSYFPPRDIIKIGYPGAD
jgi:hypothetical protein